jgi:hypothetical protein
MPHETAHAKRSSARTRGHARSARGRRLAAVVALPMLTPLFATGTANAATTPTTPTTPEVWNAAADFGRAPNQANPSNSVWHYLQSASLTHDPDGYTLLPQFVPDLAGVAGLQSWQGGAVHTPKQGLPYVGVNTRADNPFLFGVDWPSGTMLVHPLPDRYVVVGWRSPIDGDVAITGSVTDRHAACGDGVRWFVDQGAATVASGNLINGAAQSLKNGTGGGGLARVHVDFGDFLYFIVDPKANYVCDSTGLSVKISELLPVDNPANRP